MSRHVISRALAALLALSLVQVGRVALAEDDPVEVAQKKIEAVQELLKLGCPARARAALVDAEKAFSVLGEFEKEKLQGDLNSVKESIENNFKDRTAEQFIPSIERRLSPLEHAVEQAKDYPDEESEGFDKYAADIRLILTDEDNVKLLGTETCAKFERKLVWLKSEYTKAKLGGWLKQLDKWKEKIQAVLDGKDTTSYTDNVEQWFKYANEVLAKAPAEEPKIKAARGELAKQRKAFDKMMEEAAKAEILEPAVQYWSSVKENYLKECEGWESEKTPSSAQKWIRNAPPELGCPKTQKLLEEVVTRWFDDERVKTALEKFPDSAVLKPALDEASKWREEAGNKVCAFTNRILDEEEKLTNPQEKEDAQRLFGEMTRILEQYAKGSTACEKTLTRIKAIDKRWTDAKEKGEQERVALEKKLTDAANAVWPEFAKVYASQVKKIETSEALADVGAFKGTVLHFSGGAKGVNMNRSGWNYMDQYDFIVERSGVPICGNWDEGLAGALREFTGTTGVEPDNVEECFAIVEGTCKVWERVQHPLDPDRYVRGRQLDAIRVRVVAVKACTVAACVNKGTSLQKVPGFKDVAVPEAGKTR